MEQTIRLMPARCNRCGAVFDLQYDLQMDNELMGALLMAKLYGAKMLCWKCRE